MWFQLYVVAGLTTSCACGVSAQVAYDWSSPRSAFASLQKAFAQMDRDAIAAGLCGPGTTPAQIEASIKQEREEKLAHMGSWLSKLSVRHVDRKLSYGLKQDLLRRPKPFDDVARVVFTVDENRERAWWPREQKHVEALYFVRCDSRWQWYMNPYQMKTWVYELSSPRKAYDSMLLAVDNEDVLGVYDMIDPRMRVGIDRGAFMSTALERLDKIRKWEEERQKEREQAEQENRNRIKALAEAIQKEREQAKLENRNFRRPMLPPLPPPPPSPPPPPPPFKAFAGRSENDFETETFVQNGREFARVWQLRPPDKRVDSEEFVKDGDQWYWRPKPEYTVWHDMPASTQPASQPAP